MSLKCVTSTVPKTIMMLPKTSGIRYTACQGSVVSVATPKPPATDPALPDHRQEESGTGRLGHGQQQRHERALQIQAEARHEQKKKDAPAKSRKPSIRGCSKEYRAGVKQEAQVKKEAARAYYDPFKGTRSLTTKDENPRALSQA